MQHKLSKCWLLFLFIFFTAFIVLPGLLPAEANEIIGVKIMKKEIGGKYMTDSRGMTIYYSTKDEENISNCVEGCAINWPPFYIEPSAQIVGFEPEDFTAMTRTDGKLQTTYKGKPLYYFKNDTYSSDTLGLGLGDKWFTIVP